jgi:hypothetical protein
MNSLSVRQSKRNVRSLDGFKDNQRADSPLLRYRRTACCVAKASVEPGVRLVRAAAPVFPLFDLCGFVLLDRLFVLAVQIGGCHLGGSRDGSGAPGALFGWFVAARLSRLEVALGRDLFLDSASAHSVVHRVPVM